MFDTNQFLSPLLCAAVNDAAERFCGVLDEAAAKKFNPPHHNTTAITRFRAINHNPLILLDYLSSADFC
ncbi:MAG: hypothetical protein K2X06_07800 [Burkholderiales bacterium]|nr:hypothetical protein [Burkholderiales bacterium]